MKMILTAALAMSVLTAAPVRAQTISYTNFNDTTGLQINGNSAVATDASSRRVLRLTPATFSQSGSVFSTTTIPLSSNASFSTAFSFNINTNDTLGFGGADGFVFVIQTNSNSVGGSGGGIGYQGIPNSLGIEFDTYQNPGEINGNHIGVDINGNVNSASVLASPFQLDGGTDLTGFIDYDGASRLLEVRLSNNGLRPVAALLQYQNLDLSAILGSTDAFVGFTSGTGSGYSNHDILSWQFANSFAPFTGAVPEPGTWAMMIVGFGAVGGAMRRRKVRNPALA